jgi:hypothetical protein
MINALDPMYRAVFSLMMMGGFGIEEVMKVLDAGIDDFERQLSNTHVVDGVEIAQLYLPYRKHSEDPFCVRSVGRPREPAGLGEAQG